MIGGNTVLDLSTMPALVFQTCMLRRLASEKIVHTEIAPLSVANSRTCIAVFKLYRALSIKSRIPTLRAAFLVRRTV